MNHTCRRRGGTLLECLTLVCFGAMGISCAAVLTGAGRAGPDEALQDSMQMRETLQSFAVAAVANEDRYPLPSDFDLADESVALPGREKDTSAHILSMMIGGGLLSVQDCISPLEVNPSIESDDDYALVDPPTAPVPARAQWDPAFSVDFAQATGNLSYAHMQPAGERLHQRWRLLFNDVQPVLGNRGPETLSTNQEARRPQDRITLADRRSNTHRFLPPKGAWAGHIGYSDGRVERERSQLPRVTAGSNEWSTYLNEAGSVRLDALFYDEPDDPVDVNNYLGLFPVAGDMPEDYVPIWD